jgi:ABC-type dipeptide/oligopeptide/nickel transport system permease component
MIKELGLPAERPRGRDWARPLRDVAGAASSAISVLLVFATLVFLALRLLPGDPTELILGDQATAAERAHMATRLGFDAPLPVQYMRYLGGLLRFDLGASLSHPDRSAFACVASALRGTSALAMIAVGFGAVGGVLAALLSVGPWLGKYRRRMHSAILLVAATPLLAFAPLATWIFAVRLAWTPLPGDPENGGWGLLFAAALLSLPLGAQVARIGRASLLEQVGAQFLDVARAKGASSIRVWCLHALPVAAAPILVVLAAQLGALLGGAVVLERFFERPGLGTLMLEAYAARDFPVLEASIIAAGLLFVVVQTAAAGFIGFLDPRGQRS